LNNRVQHGKNEHKNRHFGKEFLSNVGEFCMAEGSADQSNWKQQKPRRKRRRSTIANGDPTKTHGESLYPCCRNRADPLPGLAIAACLTTVDDTIGKAASLKRRPFPDALCAF